MLESRSAIAPILFLGIAAIASCGSKSSNKVLDEGGMPAQLAKVKCGSTLDDVVRSYPDFVKQGNYYARKTGTERLAIMLENGQVTGGMVFDLAATPETFGKRLEQLEAELGKGTVHDGAKKAVYWDRSSGAIARVILTGDSKSVDLSIECR